ncbi:hypothetical protein LJC63_02685 [Ruminococcaceae bacterium OttesenSCG-928-L11]|nr:hypothetical protein [Ruminococcaceae bacterium OttesenSCG-928-L11]
MFKRNRFAKRRKDLFVIKDIVLPIAVIGVLLLAMNYGMDTLSTRTEAERLESTKNAVTRAAVQCYALEGRYPLSVTYLKENYGLQVDEEKYIIHYQAFASNIMPDIDVLPLDFSQTEDGDEWDVDFGLYDDIDFGEYADDGE